MPFGVGLLNSYAEKQWQKSADLFGNTKKNRGVADIKKKRGVADKTAQDYPTSAPYLVFLAHTHTTPTRESTSLPRMPRFFVDQVLGPFVKSLRPEVWADGTVPCHCRQGVVELETEDYLEWSKLEVRKHVLPYKIWPYVYIIGWLSLGPG